MTQFLDETTRRLLESRDSIFLGSLFREFNPAMLRFCVGHGVSGSDAEDAVHNTWETFFSNLDQFQGRSQIRTFVFGILLNKIREHRRAQKKIVYEEDSEKVFDQAFTLDGWWKNPLADPSQLVESHELMEFTRQCLEGLSDSQRSAFILRESEDEDPDAICNVLGVNVSHLRVLLFRAKDRLRKCIEGRRAADSL